MFRLSRVVVCLLVLLAGCKDTKGEDESGTETQKTKSTDESKPPMEGEKAPIEGEKAPTEGESSPNESDPEATACPPLKVSWGDQEITFSVAISGLEKPTVGELDEESRFAHAYRIRLGNDDNITCDNIMSSAFAPDGWMTIDLGVPISNTFVTYGYQASGQVKDGLELVRSTHEVGENVELCFTKPFELVGQKKLVVEGLVRANYCGVKPTE